MLRESGDGLLLVSAEAAAFRVTLCAWLGGEGMRKVRSFADLKAFVASWDGKEAPTGAWQAARAELRLSGALGQAESTARMGTGGGGATRYRRSLGWSLGEGSEARSRDCIATTRSSHSLTNLTNLTKRPATTMLPSWPLQPHPSPPVARPLQVRPPGVAPGLRSLPESLWRRLAASYRLSPAAPAQWPARVAR